MDRRGWVCALCGILNSFDDDGATPESTPVLTGVHKVSPLPAPSFDSTSRSRVWSPASVFPCVRCLSRKEMETLPCNADPKHHVLRLF